MDAAVRSSVQPLVPQPDRVTKFFWDGVDRGELTILRCDACKRYVHLPREVCPFCLSIVLSPHPVSGRAHLVTYTCPAQPFDSFNLSRIPYVLAVVELVEQAGLKMVTNVVDCPDDDLAIGLPLEVDFRTIAPGLTLPMFRPSSSVDSGAAA